MNNDCNDVLHSINNIYQCISFYDNDSLLAPFTLRNFEWYFFIWTLTNLLVIRSQSNLIQKKNWHLCGPKVFHSSITWLETSSFPTEVNATTIVLIPKNGNLTSVKDFKPISLCNILHKIISKVLANRLKLILSNCISLEQSAFVEDRSILDNVMLASKIIHHTRCKQKGKNREVALKIDISKSFDRVGWSYLLRVMGKWVFMKNVSIGWAFISKLPIILLLLMGTQ